MFNNFTNLFVRGNKAKYLDKVDFRCLMGQCVVFVCRTAAATKGSIKAHSASENEYHFLSNLLFVLYGCLMIHKSVTVPTL